MSLDENTQIYVTESQELLEDMETALLELERAPNDPDLIDRIFRTAHTIKGSAGLFGFEEIIAFTHTAENVLDDVRNCLLPVTNDLISLLMRAKDHINNMVEALPEEVAATSGEGEELLGMLKAFKAGISPAVAQAAAQTDESVTTDNSQPLLTITAADNTAISGNFHISLRLGADTFRQGFDPVQLFEQMQQLGEIKEAHLVTESIPALSELDAENCYLGWEIVLHSAVDKQQISEVFGLLDGAQVSILPPESRLEDYRNLIQKLPEGDAALGQILVEIGSLTADELQRALVEQKTSGGLTGDILVEQASVPTELVDAALQKQQKTREVKHAQASFVRVDAQKLDRLVNLMGELVVSSAKIAQVSSTHQDEELDSSIEEMMQAMEDMRETTLSLRMMPIGNTFSRFNRVVRDVAKELEKKIRLQITGADTELDKTVIDQIGDPLTHLIRNSLDHGLGTPQERIRAGKPEEGTIHLDAHHQSGSIIIKVSDDGRGIDPQKIRQIAERRGLIQPEQKMTEQEVLLLIFEPGFSTAEKANNLSGRGVGMDVVRRNIEALRGTVEIQSTLGQGTTMTIQLPLTLAIIDGFHIAVGTDSFIIPLDAMVECVALTEQQLVEVTTHDYINLRDEILPLINLRRHFHIQSKQRQTAGQDRQNVVVVQFADKKVGLLVDTLHGEAQVVIKPLGSVFQGINGFAGFTILGSGNVALIMDILDLIKLATKNDRNRHQPRRMTAAGAEAGVSIH